MKSRIAVAVASLFLASLGTAAYAQGAQQMTPPASATSSPTMNSNSMGTNSSMSSDQVSRKVKHELTAHGVTATNVDVTFSDGTATLSGTVFNQADIAKAKKAAMRVRGVKHVDTSGLHARSQGTASARS